MKRETNNNEIDLLLRRLGRREDGSSPEVLIDGEHLDADELSSYAQNALPAAAHARYTAHLAECSACRKLVTELSLSLGAPTVTEPAKTVPVPGGLKKFLASLFSPMVLRYAAPVLGVVLVMVVGFVVLRQRSAAPNRSLVAQLEEKRVNEPVVKNDYGAKADAPGAVNPAQGFNNTPGKPTEPKPAGTPAAEAAGAGVGAAAPPPKEANAEAPVVAQRQVQDLPSPQSSATTKLMAADDTQKKPEETGKKQTETVTVEARNSEVKNQSNEPVKTASRTEKFQNTDRIAIDRTATAKTEDADKNKAAAPAPAAGVASLGSARPDVARRRAENERAANRDKRAADEEKSEETKREDTKREENTRLAKDGYVETETRTVAGRRFRKQRGIWVDTAYDSEKDATTVKRNSEQFRALVADEPAIRTISEQLDGEVLVVWKGRTYRIR
jgi:hypothetical protein